mmetsp:Transcript_33575/g.80982  ORF Transcript_33575/g.80982 Transcript_33575/m.80982 type:complete len:86 (-) Transcript_33575:666-923(-)
MFYAAVLLVLLQLHAQLQCCQGFTVPVGVSTTSAKKLQNNNDSRTKKMPNTGTTTTTTTMMSTPTFVLSVLTSPGWRRRICFIYG